MEPSLFLQGRLFYGYHRLAYYKGYYRGWCTPIAEAYFNMTVDQETVIIGEWKKRESHASHNETWDS